MRVIRRPAIAMRHFVLADLRLNPGGDRPADARDHDKATVSIHLGTAQCAMRRYNSVHGVTEAFDLRERALADRHRAAVAMPVNGWRGIDGINGSLRQGHHCPVARVDSMGGDDPNGIGAGRAASMNFSSER
jgi:hypothetical protein